MPAAKKREGLTSPEERCKVNLRAGLMAKLMKLMNGRPGGRDIKTFKQEIHRTRDGVSSASPRTRGWQGAQRKAPAKLQLCPEPGRGGAGCALAEPDHLPQGGGARGGALQRPSPTPNLLTHPRGHVAQTSAYGSNAPSLRSAALRSPCLSSGITHPYPAAPHSPGTATRPGAPKPARALERPARCPETVLLARGRPWAGAGTQKNKAAAGAAPPSRSSRGAPQPPACSLGRGVGATRGLWASTCTEKRRPGPRALRRGVAVFPSQIPNVSG